MNLVKVFFILIISISWCDASEELKEYIDIALELNPSIKVSKIEIEIGRNQLKSEYTNFAPTVSANATQSQSKVGESINDASNVGVSANLNIFNGFKDSTNIENSNINLKLLKLELKRKESDIRFKVKKAYFNYLSSNESFQLLSQIEKRRKKQLELIQLRYQGGREDQGSFLQAKAQYEKSTIEKVQAERQLKTYRKDLENALGRPLLENELPQGELISYIKDLPAVLFEENLVKAIPEYQLKALNYSVAKNNIKISNSEFSPTLDLQGSYNKGGDTFQELDTSSRSVSLVLSIPIFEGGKRFFDRSAAKLEKMKAEYQINEVFNELRASVVNEINNYQSSIENTKVKLKFFESSKVRSEIATSQYKSGIINYTNWDLVQGEYIENEKNVIVSRKSALVSKAQLDNLFGR